LNVEQNLCGMPLAYGFRAIVQCPRVTPTCGLRVALKLALKLALKEERRTRQRKDERTKRDLASAAVGSIFVGP
jgi:hypothetical protein